MKMFCVIPLLSMTCLLSAQELPESIYPTGDAEAREMVDERVFHYRVMTYQPEVVVNFNRAKAEGSHNTPEEAAIAHFSAMKNGDYAWFESTWTKASLNQNRARNLESGRDESFWLATWRRVLNGKTIRLLKRVESAPYVLIHYRMTSDDGTGRPFEATLALEKENGRWLITQKLTSDPVYLYWRQNIPRQRRIIR